MLDIVRNKQKSILLKVVFGAIILSFIIGYAMLTTPGDRQQTLRSEIAARVNGDDISYVAYQQAHSNLYNLYKSIYQGNFNAEVEKKLNLPQQAIGQLIDEALLIQEAKRQGLDVDKKELVDSIAQIDAFKLENVFNRDRYIEVLNYQRMSVEQFEAAQYRQLVAQKLRDQLQQGIELNDEELRERFHQEQDTINLNFVQLTPALLATKITIDNAGLKTYYKENVEQFRISERLSLRYLQFEPARYEKDVVNFTDEEIDRYYRQNRDKFEIKEEVKAAHILIRVPEEADDTTKQKKSELAADLLRQLKAGADFSELAKAHSDDAGNAAKGGDLGHIGRGIMVSNFENAAFALKPGQLSDVVKTQFGLHIIKVEEATEAGTKKKEYVLDEIKAGLVPEKARRLAYEKAMDAYNINRKKGNLNTAAKSNDLGIKETGFFGRDDAIDGIGKIAAINKAAFTLKNDGLARPIQTPNGIFLITIKERQPSRLPELEEVKAAVEQAYRNTLSEAQAQSIANKLLISATEMKSLNKAAKDLKLTVEETGEFSSSYKDFVPRLGSIKGLAEEAFTLSAENPIGSKIYTIDNKSIAISLKEVKQADFDTLDSAARIELSDRLLAAKKEEAVNNKLGELKNQAKLEIIAPELGLLETK